MCGIAGYVVSRGSFTVDPLLPMLDSIRHRGPDSGGTWIDAAAGVALGHRRLSIVDLSPAGHQPMVSACGRYVITFNGEIYNHREVRNRLDQSGCVPSGGWRGHSDTETLLAAIAAWGLTKALQASVGMFALALWDTRERALKLARDRIGEKPLFYGWQGDTFVFASELKAIRRHPSFIGEIDWRAASTFLRLNFIPAPSTIYRGLLKLMPGCAVALRWQDLQTGNLPEPEAYWSLADAALGGKERPFSGGFDDATEALDLLLSQVVQDQSNADVPLGAFLSGGIDSSLVVAKMQEQSRVPVTTFSIGMPEAAMDESAHAAAVARHLGTDHVAHTIRPSEALDLIPQLPHIWDEPLADSSQIPTYLVSRIARRKVTVALSGDGGDEFFLGYNLYPFYQNLWKWRALGVIPWDTMLRLMSPLTRFDSVKVAARRADSVVSAWRQTDPQMLARFWFDRYRGGRVPINEQREVELIQLPRLPGVAETAGLWDAGTYLPDDILTKVDRASMANSLETRAPLLDHRLIEFALTLPENFKISRSTRKKVLREVLYRHVPRGLVDRPKVGFSIPLAEWLRKELREWAQDVLGEVRVGPEVFDQQMVDRIWLEHLSGKDHTEKLWGILSLTAFIRGRRR
jgi:asparagine synthase (glutamine-hydrolysing)